jgi:hypothetical protein
MNYELTEVKGSVVVEDHGNGGEKSSPFRGKTFKKRHCPIIFVCT